MEAVGKVVEELIEAIKEEIEKLPLKRKEVFVKSKIEGLKNLMEIMGLPIPDIRPQES